ncbi:translation factor pelota, partial [mine drainage metagenome]
LMELFLKGLSASNSSYGKEEVRAAIEEMRCSKILVNDSVLGNHEIQELLSLAERQGIGIEIFNSNDEAGTQLHSFKEIAAII